MTSPCGCSEQKLCGLGEGKTDLTRQQMKIIYLHVMGYSLLIFIPAVKSKEGMQS